MHLSYCYCLQMLALFHAVKRHVPAANEVFEICHTRRLVAIHAAAFEVGVLNHRPLLALA